MRAAAAHLTPDVERILRVGSDQAWPAPLALASELPPVEVMRAELLPGAFCPLVCDVAERMQVPLDYPAAVVILSLAGAVNRRAVIQPKARDSSWVVVPNLWGALIAPPGFLKSPVIETVTRPLVRVQEQWRHEHKQALADYERLREEFDLQCAAWRDQFKASAKSGEPVLAQRPEGNPQGPTLRRLVVNDATFEAMHRTMSENPAGILVVRDELPGWWAQLDKPGREGERAFCLQAWNGDSGFIVDRIGRGTVHVEACCMSMVGGVQPGRLRSYLADALEDGPANDGLIQRFQVLVWPDPPRDWQYLDRPPDADASSRAAAVLEDLVSVDPQRPLRLQFCGAAQELFEVWLGELETKVRGDDLHPALISHLAKYRKLMPALALLFELADSGTGSISVSLQHAQQAAAWCDYLESHSRRVYSCVTTPQLRAARELAAKIERRKVGTEGVFSCREVYLKGWSGLDTPEAVRQAAEVLEDAGWVRAINCEPGPLGGRPSERFEINPRVRHERK